MIDEFFNRVTDGGGRALVFEGGSGMGKTALLRVLRDQASDLDIQVLHARAAEYERNFAWGVARQLFERWVADASKDEKRTVLSGAAGLAAPLLTYDEGPVSFAHDRHPTVHGLYWMCRNLSDRKPVVLVVDDAHWADAESLNMLAYLANRLEDGPIGLVMATVPLEEVSQGELLAAATISPFARLARLQPLGMDAMKEMVAAEFDGDPEDTFVQACQGASRGNPMFVRELLAHAVDAGLDPVDAEVPKLREMAPRRMAVHLLRNLNRLGSKANRVANAVAVLGADAHPRHCAAVAELSNGEATEAARALVEAGILRVGVPLGFTHPMTQNLVYSNLTAQDRHQTHRLAAHALSDAGEPVALVAQHLLETLPGADEWVIEILRDAAAQCLQDGDPSGAVKFLRRALAEPPGEALGRDVLAELGAAELRARDEAATGHLAEALRGPGTSADRHRACLDLGHALLAEGRHQDAVDVLAEGIGGAKPEAAKQLRSVLLVITQLTDARAPLGVVEENSWEPAHAALRGLCSGLPADRVARLATAGLSRGNLLQDCDIALPASSLAAWALARSGGLLAATKALSVVSDEAQEAGHLLAADTAVGMRSLLLLEAGKLSDAESTAMSMVPDGETALASPGEWLAAAAFIQTAIELDRLQDAQPVVNRFGPELATPSAAYCLPFGIAKACLTIADGELDDGIQQLLHVRDISVKFGWHFPGASAQYLIPLTNALARTDRTELAFSIIQEELVVARAFGAPRPLAVALHAYGLFIGGRRGLDALEEAAHLLEGSPFRLELAYAQVDWGSGLRRAGRRGDARQLLVQGTRLAQECGAVSLSRLARSELRLAGGRLRTATQPVAAQLTPAEQRVVTKAAEGLSNKQIAQDLFVTVKTVEWHLGQAYRKLGINRRADLVNVLPEIDLEEEAESAVC